MKNFTIKNLIVALVLITGAIILLSYVRHLVCDGCLELKILSNIILAGISILFILRYGFGKILRDGMRMFSIWTLVAVALLTMAFIEMEHILLPEGISTVTNVKFFLSNLSTGFFEEVFFRVLVFYFIMQRMKNTKNAIWKSTLWTSLCFGLAHSLNFVSGLDIISSISLIVFATLVGIVLQGFYLRTKSIILVAVLHGLINYFGKYDSYFMGRSVAIVKSFDWNSLLSSLAIFGVLSLIIIVPIRWYLIFRARVPEDYLS